MAKLQLKAGTTSKDINIFAQDSSVATGAGLTGLVFNSGSLTAYYHRQGAASAVAITLATKTVGTWATGGFVVVDGTNMPGLYELGIPDAALAAGAAWAIIMLKGAANMAPVVLEIELTANDNQDSVRGGMTALPNAAAGANGGLPTGNASGQVAVASFANNAITAASINADAITAAKIADGAIDAATFAAGAINAAAIATDAITAAKIAADAIGASELATDAVTEIQGGLATASSITTLTGYVDTEVAVILAAVDTEVATLVTNVAAILAKTNNLPTDPADASDIAAAIAPLATAASIVTLQTSVDDLPTNAELATSQAAADDATLAAIAALNNLSAAQVKTQSDQALADYDPPTKAELDSAVAPLATAVALATVAGYIDTEVASILGAVDTEVATLVTNVAAILADIGVDGVVLSAATMQAIADAVLTRSASNTEASAGIYSLTALILAAFESAISGATWTINKTDGVTPFATRAVTTDAAADPIVSVQ